MPRFIGGTYFVVETPQWGVEKRRRFKQTFNPSVSGASEIAASVKDQALDQALNGLLNPSAQKGGSREKPESELEAEDGMMIAQVLAARVESNQSKREPPHYISQGILQKISGQTVAEVKLWFAEHERAVKQHNANYELTPMTNRRIRRGFNDKEELGLEDTEQ